MLLLVGLGNPGSRYTGNRHNIGFMAVEAIAKRHDIAPWRLAYQSSTATGLIGGERVLLLRPETFMNDSGRAVVAAASYHRINRSKIVVFHDEIELPPAKVRVKIGGSDAGHNGLRSITAHIGSDYCRVRIGVGRPRVKELVERYVLSDFANNERRWVEALCGIIADNAELLVEGRIPNFQNKVHLAMRAKGFFEDTPDEPAD